MLKNKQHCRLTPDHLAKMPRLERNIQGPSGTESSAGDGNRSSCLTALPKILNFPPLEKLKSQNVAELEDRQPPGGRKPHYILGTACEPAMKEDMFPVGV